MDSQVRLKLNKSDVAKCIAKHFPLGSFFIPCNGLGALSPKSSAVNRCYINYCEYGSMCARLRRKI